MPILPLRFNRTVTLASVMKAYDEFEAVTADELEAMRFLQGSRNFSWSCGVNFTDPTLILTANGLGVDTEGTDHFFAYYGRFDDTNFRTAGMFGNYDLAVDFSAKGKVENGGYVYLVDSVVSDFGGDDSIDLVWWRTAFALNGTNTNVQVTETVTNLGTWADSGSQLLISWTDQQYDWPTGKAIVMGYGSEAASPTFMRLYGLVVDGTTTLEVVNIGEFDYADFHSATMVGNNQTAGANDSAVFMFDASDAGHLYRLEWTAQAFANGAGTFDCEATEYTLDDVGIQADIATGVTAVRAVASHDTCNFMFSTQGWLAGYPDRPPYLVVISKDWDWYDLYTFEAAEGDADAQAVIDAYTDLSATNGSIAYNADEGLLYFAAGGSDPFTYCTATFDPCGDGAGGGEVDEDITLRVWGFSLDDHDFAVFRLGDAETLVFDLKTKQWSQWASPLIEYWRPHVGMNWIGASTTTMAHGFGSDIVCGDDTEGVLYILDPTAGQDDDPVTGTPASFTRRVTGSMTLRGRTSAPCNAVQLTISLGNPILTGARFNLRTSDDVGHTWLNHGDQVVVAGSYGQVVEWRALGMMRQTGRLFSFEDDGAAVRISGADLR